MSVTTSSNPISSISPSSSPITSVDQYPPSYNQSSPSQGQQQQLHPHLTLEMRHQRFVVERETLLNLPESVLLGMFPNGLILSRGQMGGRGGQGGYGGDEEEEDEGEGVYPIDFDPESFRYILSFWSKAHQDFYGTATSPGFYQRQQHLHGHGPGGSYGQGQSQGGNHGDYPGGPGENPLISRQPIIVLREELEYFSIVPSSNPDVNPDLSTVLPDKISMAAKVGEDGRATEELRRIKREAGKALVDRKKVFTALQRNVSKEGNLAEQHLIDMLCMSGFAREDDWGYRSLEPSRTVISSIALVLLKTGIQHPPSRTSKTKSDKMDDGESSVSSSDEDEDEGDSFVNENKKKRDAREDYDEEDEVRIDQNQMSTAQKLLLFWRKPARKCWWDGVHVDIPVEEGSKETVQMKVWARRVWTLELSLL